MHFRFCDVNGLQKLNNSPNTDLMNEVSIYIVFFIIYLWILSITFASIKLYPTEKSYLLPFKCGFLHFIFCKIFPLNLQVCVKIDSFNHQCNADLKCFV